jgi:hypothetical protein
VFVLITLASLDLTRLLTRFNLLRLFLVARCFRCLLFYLTLDGADCPFESHAIVTTTSAVSVAIPRSADSTLFIRITSLSSPSSSSSPSPSSASTLMCSIMYFVSSLSLSLSLPSSTRRRSSSLQPLHALFLYLTYSLQIVHLFRKHLHCFLLSRPF